MESNDSWSLIAFIASRIIPFDPQGKLAQLYSTRHNSRCVERSLTNFKLNTFNAQIKMNLAEIRQQQKQHSIYGPPKPHASHTKLKPPALKPPTLKLTTHNEQEEVLEIFNPSKPLELLTAAHILSMGLHFCNFSEEKQRKVSLKRNMTRYKQNFGPDPTTNVPMFKDLSNKYPSFSYKDGLMTLNWLWNRCKYSELTGRWGPC